MYVGEGGIRGGGEVGAGHGGDRGGDGGIMTACNSTASFGGQWSRQGTAQSREEVKGGVSNGIGINLSC